MMTFYLQSVVEEKLMFFPAKVNWPNNFSMVKFMKSKKPFSLYFHTSVLIKDSPQSEIDFPLHAFIMGESNAKLKKKRSKANWA